MSTVTATFLRRPFKVSSLTINTAMLRSQSKVNNISNTLSLSNTSTVETVIQSGLSLHIATCTISPSYTVFRGILFNSCIISSKNQSPTPGIALHEGKMTVSHLVSPPSNTNSRRRKDKITRKTADSSPKRRSHSSEPKKKNTNDASCSLPEKSKKCPIHATLYNKQCLIYDLHKLADFVQIKVMRKDNERKLRESVGDALNMENSLWNTSGPSCNLDKNLFGKDESEDEKLCLESFIELSNLKRISEENPKFTGDGRAGSKDNLQQKKGEVKQSSIIIKDVLRQSPSEWRSAFLRYQGMLASSDKDITSDCFSEPLKGLPKPTASQPSMVTALEHINSFLARSGHFPMENSLSQSPSTIYFTGSVSWVRPQEVTGSSTTAPDTPYSSLPFCFISPHLHRNSNNNNNNNNNNNTNDGNSRQLLKDNVSGNQTTSSGEDNVSSTSPSPSASSYSNLLYRDPMFYCGGASTIAKDIKGISLGGNYNENWSIPDFLKDYRLRSDEHPKSASNHGVSFGSAFDGRDIDGGLPSPLFSSKQISSLLSSSPMAHEKYCELLRRKMMLDEDYYANYELLSNINRSLVNPNKRNTFPFFWGMGGSIPAIYANNSDTSNRSSLQNKLRVADEVIFQLQFTSVPLHGDGDCRLQHKEDINEIFNTSLVAVNVRRY